MSERHVCIEIFDFVMHTFALAKIVFVMLNRKAVVLQFHFRVKACRIKKQRVKSLC